MPGVLVSDETLVAAARVVDLVEPAREEEYRLPETKREALEHLESLVVRCRWLAALDVIPEHGWAGSQRTAKKLIDFIFEGHAEHDPRLAADHDPERERAA